MYICVVKHLSVDRVAVVVVVVYNLATHPYSRISHAKMILILFRFVSRSERNTEC